MRRHWKAAKALIFVMPLLGFGHILSLVVSPAVEGLNLPAVLAVYDAVEAVILSSQGLVISLPYCFLNSEVQGVVRSRWRRWRMVRTVGRSASTSTTYAIVNKPNTQVQEQHSKGDNLDANLFTKMLEIAPISVMLYCTEIVTCNNMFLPLHVGLSKGGGGPHSHLQRVEEIEEVSTDLCKNHARRQCHQFLN